MEGYDTALLGNFYALPQFNQIFRVPVGNGTYQLTPAWQSGLENDTQIGQICGLMEPASLQTAWFTRRHSLELI